MSDSSRKNSDIWIINNTQVSYQTIPLIPIHIITGGYLKKRGLTFIKYRFHNTKQEPFNCNQNDNTKYNQINSYYGVSNMTKSIIM